MGIPHYLAMTAAELSQAAPPENTAYMACHFSSYNTGLSNLPNILPPGAILLLDDSTPPDIHSPEEAAAILWDKIEELECRGLLLDFQRSENPHVLEMARYLAQRIPCPVAVSHLYAADLDCPVFLPPLPLYTSLEAWTAPWKGREIWLETCAQGTVLTLTPDGCTSAILSEPLYEGFAEERLHCHYRIETGKASARFSLWRTEEDWTDFLEDAENFGVTLTVGLWQELHD